MEKLKLERVYRAKKTTKFGEKDNISIKVDSNKYIGSDGSPAWISSFKTKGTEHWKEGDVVEITVTENKGYYNFVLGEDLSLESLNERLKKVENILNKSDFDTDAEISI